MRNLEKTGRDRSLPAFYEPERRRAGGNRQAPARLAIGRGRTCGLRRIAESAADPSGPTAGTPLPPRSRKRLLPHAPQTASLSQRRRPSPFIRLALPSPTARRRPKPRRDLPGVQAEDDAFHGTFATPSNTTKNVVTPTTTSGTFPARSDARTLHSITLHTPLPTPAPPPSPNSSTPPRKKVEVDSVPQPANASRSCGPVHRLSDDFDAAHASKIRRPNDLRSSKQAPRRSSTVETFMILADSRDRATA